MAQPTAYVPATDFSTEQAANPTAHTSGAKLDVEFLALRTTTDGIRTNIAAVVRDDLALKNGIVTPDSLSSATLALLQSSGWTVSTAAWATATAYPANVMLSYTGGGGLNGTYVSTVAHTSGTFSTDLSAGKWVLVYQPLTIPLPVASGGTNATTASDARAQLSAAERGANSTITSLTGLTTPLSVAQGGTSGATAADARTGIGAAAAATTVTANAPLTGSGTLGANLTLGFDTNLLRNFISGLRVQNDGSDPTNDIVIGAGVAMDDTNTALMRLPTALTKRLDASWAVGTNEGMRATGAAISDTTYHVYLVMRPDTGVVDVAATTSGFGAFTGLDAAYTLKRRICSIVRASSAIRKFIQTGDYFAWESPPKDIGAANPGTSAVDRALTVPSGFSFLAHIGVGGQNSSNNWWGLISAKDSADIAPTSSLFNCSIVGAAIGTDGINSTLWVRTDTSRTVRSRISHSGASDSIAIVTIGWIDRRGQDD